MKISGSILNLENKQENLRQFVNSGIDYIHVDVMDGKFVTNISLPIEEVEQFPKYDNYDVHLMVENVKEYIDQFKKINPVFITFHLETDNVKENIEYLKKLNIKVGLSIKPNTDFDLIIPYLEMIDLVLVMSVEPGLGGQEFLESSIEKINKLVDIRTQKNLNFVIEVDGGINEQTINYVKDADIAVVGSYITKYNYHEQVQKLKEVLK